MRDDRYDIIIQYLNGEMTADRKMLFEQELIADKELQEDVSLLENLRSRLKEDALNKSLSEISVPFFNTGGHQDAVTHNSKVVKKRMIEFMPKWTWLAAACIIGIISISILWFLHQEKARQTNVAQLNRNNEQAKDTNRNQPVIIDNKNTVGSQQSKPDFNALYAENFEKDKIPDEGTEDIQYAITQYQRSKYTDAIYAFNAAKNDVSVRGGSGDSALTAFYTDYYMALSYMLNNEAAKAIPLLEKAGRDTDEKFLQARSEWYLSLACIRTGNIAKAKALLIKLSANKTAGVYKNKAVSLLPKLGE